MALKDWKIYIKHPYKIGWEKGLKHVIIYHYQKRKWIVSTTLYASDDKYFKSKPQALKYAKAYMRKH